MPFLPPPRSASWIHQEARVGFEVAYFQPVAEGYLLSGCTTAAESDIPWIVDYEIGVDAAWITRSVQVRGRSSAGSRVLVLTHDGSGAWMVDGQPAPHLDGCFDVDLESSALTNALPVHRLDLVLNQRTEAPAAYVRAHDLVVDRLEQQYTRMSGQNDQHRYEYTAPSFDFACQLIYDNAGITLTYPGIAMRAT